MKAKFDEIDEIEEMLEEQLDKVKKLKPKEKKKPLILHTKHEFDSAEHYMQKDVNSKMKEMTTEDETKQKEILQKNDKTVRLIKIERHLRERS